MDIDGDTSVVSSKLPIAQSLKVTAKAISDYYTKAEYTSFMKPKASKEKKLRKVRKKEEEVDLLEGIEDVSSGAVNGTVNGTEGNSILNGHELNPLCVLLHRLSLHLRKYYHNTSKYSTSRHILSYHITSHHIAP